MHIRRYEYLNNMPVYSLKQSLARIFLPSGSDSDGDLFDEVTMAPRRRKMSVTDITKVAVHTHPHSPNKDSANKDQRYILPEPRPSTQPSNYIDCTESNDDDDDDDELSDVTDEPLAPAPPRTEMPCSPPTSNSDTTPSKLAPPRWENFFRADPVLTDESELDNSQTTQTTDNTTSQSPELFREDDEDDSCHMTSSQSTHISDDAPESSSQIDTVLVQVDESKAVSSDQETNGVFKNGTCKPGEVGSDAIDSCNVKAKAEEATEQKSDSQVSSDFELPPTPGSKVPEPEDLKELYRKLAAGHEVVKRKVF